MELNDDAFWEALQRQVAQAEADEVEELAEAERLLAEIDNERVEPLPEEQIDAMVRLATTQGLPAAAEVTAPADVAPAATELEPSTAPATFSRFAQMRRFLAAAAAFMLAPKFLVAATAVTVVVVTTVMVRYSTWDLPYQDAISIMMDDSRSELERQAGQRRVSFDLIESISILQGSGSENSAIGGQAAVVLEQLRATLDDGGTFEADWFSDPLFDLGRQVADLGLDLELRQEALSQLGSQLVYGMQALKAIERISSHPDLERDNGIWLRQLADLLVR